MLGQDDRIRSAIAKCSTNARATTAKDLHIDCVATVPLIVIAAQGVEWTVEKTRISRTNVKADAYDLRFVVDHAEDLLALINVGKERREDRLARIVIDAGLLSR